MGWARRFLLLAACAISSCDPQSPDPKAGPALPADQKSFLERRLHEHLQKQPRFGELRTALLRCGGIEVVPRQEPDLEKLLARGKQMPSGSVSLRSGDPSDCHRNAAALWKKEDGRLAIATGWALSPDGLWRQHSWLCDGPMLIETTEKRDAYFGILLTAEEAGAFWSENR